MYSIFATSQPLRAACASFFLISATHYRNPINFSDAVDEAAAKVAYFYETLRKVDDFPEGDFDEFEGPILEQAFIDGLTKQFEDALNDDFTWFEEWKLFTKHLKCLMILYLFVNKSKTGARAAALG